MPRIFYIGCTHFDHHNIIKLCNRPFDDADHMNEVMVKNWNEVVTNDDIVYHLGDFGWRPNSNRFLLRLNGKIIRTQGNHDPKGWGEPYQEIKDGEWKVMLFHYPIEEWNGWYNDTLHIHAHTHKKQVRSGARRFNVSADAVKFTPRTLEELISGL